MLQLTDTEFARACGIKLLMRGGNLHVPCSRYGHDTESCAPVAWALTEIIADATGEPITPEALDYSMGLVVNDHDDVESLILAYGSHEDIELLDLDLVRDRVRDAALRDGQQVENLPLAALIHYATEE